MRILYHHRTRAEDAQGVHIRAMVNAFRQLGHEVEVVALVPATASAGGPAAKQRLSLATRSLPDWLYELMSLSYNLYGYRRLARAIRARRPDVIYERYALNTVCGVWASRRFGIPHLLEVNAPLFLEQDRLGKLVFKRLARASERWVCAKSTRTIVVSEVMRELLAREGVSREHMVVMPNGIDPERFNPRVSGAAIRHRYGLGNRAVVGFVGWFRPWHGLDMLVEAMHHAGLFDQGVRLLLVGDGPAYAELHRYAETHGLLSAIVFSGPTAPEEIPAHIAAMDVAVQPSATEYACPMKVIEYMAMARCIVAVDQRNIRELVEDGVSGFLFEPGNPRSLAKVLAGVLADPDKRAASGQRAAQRVGDRRWLWTANAERVLAMVQDEARSRSASRCA